MAIRGALSRLRERGVQWTVVMILARAANWQQPRPPTFPSEGRPDTFRYDHHGLAYDHLRVRGVDVNRILGPRLESELAFAARAEPSGSFADVQDTLSAEPPIWATRMEAARVCCCSTSPAGSERRELDLRVRLLAPLRRADVDV